MYITPSDTVPNLGVTSDSDFNFRKHVSLTCRSCFYHIRDLRRIRRYISLSVAKTIATAFTTKRHDYSNSFFYNIASKDILKLQCVQNCLAMVVTRSSRISHSFPFLKYLYWGHVQSRIIFTLCTIDYQTPSSGEPSCFLQHSSLYNCFLLVFTFCLFPGLKVMLGLVLFLSLLSGIHFINTLSHQIASFLSVTV